MRTFLPFAAALALGNREKVLIIADIRLQLARVSPMTISKRLGSTSIVLRSEAPIGCCHDGIAE